jgi:hypothetical protein
MTQADLPINPLRGCDNSLWDASDAEYLKSRKVIGLTKREHFAGLAMQGILANSDPQIASAPFENIAIEAVKLSDLLLKELLK